MINWLRNGFIWHREQETNIWLSPAIEKYFVNRLDKQFKGLYRFYPIYIDSFQVQTKFLYKVAHSKNRQSSPKIGGQNTGEITTLISDDVNNPIPVKNRHLVKIFQGQTNLTSVKS